MKPAVWTEHPIAFHSPDHIHAFNGGAGNDNSIHPGFNAKLAKYFNRPYSLLDFGCAGGGLVKTVIDDGNFAVGLEGSDCCKVNKRREWVTIPDNLFTCDLTKPFFVYNDEQHFDGKAEDCIKFDIITAWEVMEHFLEDQLEMVISNALCHLAEGALWIMSVSEQPDGGVYHRCLHNKTWWLRKFGERGLVNRDDMREYIDPDWVRGPKSTKWAIEAPMSFHLVLEKPT
jgi:2-polyprenyl-3-methyl-5-hydroxy-6-metoxy-1,4-benzoquinol methylase